MKRDQDLVQITPSQAKKQYFESRRGEVRETTLQSQSTGVKRFAKWCEDHEKELSGLTGMDVQKFYNELKKEDYAKATLRNYMTAVRQFLLYLERVEAAPPDIADKVHRPVLEKSERRRDTEIDPERVKEVVDWLSQFKYASRDHIIMLLLWHCGIRTGSLRALDLKDFTHLDKDPVLQVKHRPDKGTPLKNGLDGERPINISDEVADTLKDYIEHNRFDNTDEHGRKPLIPSYNRYSQDQIRKTCLYYTCPKTTGIGTCNCEEQRTRQTATDCEKSVSPHVIRSASITYWRQKDVPVEAVSDRMNVSRDVIEQHYDRRTEEGKAQQRRKYLNQL